MSLADAITASTPVATSAGRKAPVSNKNVSTEERPRNNSPAFLAYDAKKNACDARIADIRARIDAAKNGYSMAGGDNLSEKNKTLRFELIEKVKALRGELKTIEDERRGLSNQFSETLENLKKKSSDVNSAKEKMSFKSTAEIDGRIREIESTLESGRFTLSEERQMLQEITKLRKMRKALDNMDGTTGNDVTSLRLRLDQIKLRQGDVDARITAKKEEINAVNSKIDALNGVRAVEQAKRADSKTEIEGFRKELDAEYAKKKAAWDEYLQVKAAKEAAYHRMVARKEEQTRVAGIEDEIDELERNLGRLTSESVIDKKWNECTNLINFFLPFAPHVLENETVTPAAPAKNIRKVDEIDFSKVQVLKKEDECYFVSSKSSKKQQKKSAASESVAASEAPAADISKLPFHIIAALTDMTLPVPKSVETDLPDLLRTIQSRRNDLQVHREASLSEMEQKRNVIIKEIEVLRNKIESKDEQITASVVKKAEKAEKAAASAETAAEEEEEAAVAAAEEEEEAAVAAAEEVVDEQAEN